MLVRPAVKKGLGLCLVLALMGSFDLANAADRDRSDPAVGPAVDPAIDSTPGLVPDPAPDPAPDPVLCRALVRHVPDADVTYLPGVDVHGKPVAPADLPANRIQIPDNISIPLTVSLAKAINLNVGQYPANQLGPGTESQLGTLTLRGDRVFFNGQPLSDAEQDNLAVLCMKKK